MSRDRPFLTAAWTELLMLNFPVPAEVVERIAPRGTEPDLRDGRAQASVVGFMFRDARLLGLAPPGYGLFEEVNLRYYVRRRVEGRWRPGVVFVQEIAPRRLISWIARWVYNESYVTRPMTNDNRMAGRAPAAGDQIDYRWRTGARKTRRWNRMAARAAAAPQLPERGSLAEFIVEHYWAYVRGRDGSTWEYRVAHRPWRVAPATNVVWDCDLAATYDTPLAPYLDTAPASALVVDGSAVQVFHGRRLGTQAELESDRERVTAEQTAGINPAAR